MVRELLFHRIVNRVLVAETDRLIHYALSKTLQSCDVEIRSVSNGDDAMSEVRSCFYPLCILDISTPGLGSMKVFKSIKETSPQTQIIMISKEADADGAAQSDMEKMVGKYVCYCLAKPFEMSELKAIVRQVLNKDTEDPYSVRRRATRTYEKIPVSYTVTVVELGKPTCLTLNGHTVDICENGLGMRTHYPLEPGHLIMFNHGTDKRSGIVRWSAMHEESSMYHVGVEFLESRDVKV